ncbi:hypothetical protein MJO29_011001, partial [Puccinia striiformis f. sp. tritici]
KPTNQQQTPNCGFLQDGQLILKKNHVNQNQTVAAICKEPATTSPINNTLERTKRDPKHIQATHKICTSLWIRIYVMTYYIGTHDIYQDKCKNKHTSYGMIH